MKKGWGRCLEKLCEVVICRVWSTVCRSLLTCMETNGNYKYSWLYWLGAYNSSHTFCKNVNSTEIQKMEMLNPYSHHPAAPHNRCECFGIYSFGLIYKYLCILPYFKHYYFCKLGSDFCLVCFLWYPWHSERYVVWYVAGTYSIFNV